MAATLAIGVAPASASAPRDALLVFAAASLQNAMSNVVDAYNKRRGANIKASYAGSSTLARQIERGAPADIYLSANQQWMNTLEKDGLIRGSSRIDLLRNSLVLVAPRASPVSLSIKPGFDLVDALHGRPLAMANTRSVPAGIYGRQALTAMGVWHSVKSQVAQGADVRAALALVARGQVPLGVVYASDARAEKRVRVVDTFPAASHKRIVYPAAILKNADTRRAKPFMRFLQTKTAATIFRRWGFGLVRN